VTNALLRLVQQAQILLEIKSDVNEIHTQDSNSEGESDNETSMFETKPNMSQGKYWFWIDFH
jgi:hypothetical protein